mmetsp:Transcript_89341/g.286276  ORF Transcript_89341/g.286276 Transcript_89341/m.286276 type:complete len:439 (+) Transcript_89341:99-1415(+)
MCSLSSASGLQALLAEHRAQLGALAAAVDELRAGQQALAEAKRDASGTHANLAKDHRCLFRRHATLQDEHEALRDCLSMAGVLKPIDLQQRISMRRATEVLRSVLEAPGLALAVGLAVGPNAAQRLCEASRGHGGAMVACMKMLRKKVPADIYVVGGKNDASVALVTVERYSPASNEWRAVPPMRVARYGCAAASLGGRLYVAGGHDGKQAVPSVERFSPLSNRWEFLPPMPSARSRATAVAARGRLFVVGGRDSRATASPVPTLAAVESYDPRLGRWEVLPSLPLAPLGCSASVVQGQIYVVGVNLEREMAVQRLDLQVFCWTSVRAVPRRRFGCAAAALSGTIYVMGGHDGEHPVSCSERFDPLGGGGDGGDGGDGRGEAELWEELTPAPTARHGCAAVAAGGGLYLLGGDDQGSMAAAERYDPELGAPCACRASG